VPTYQYACTECGERLEAVQSFSDPALTVCPACQGKLRKVFNSVGIVFKGSGFYRNDSRAGDVTAEKANAAASAADSSKPSTDSSKSGSDSSKSGSESSKSGSDTKSTPAKSGDSSSSGSGASKAPAATS
jgi:putative FmdB family regulatory protein